MERASTTPDRQNAGYEVTDFSPRPVLLFGVGILVLVGVSFVLLIGVLKVLEHLNPPGPAASLIARPPQIPPSPRLEIEEGGDYGEALRHSEAILNHYGWADRQAGKVRIPIDRAIDILAERGLPSRPAAPPAAQGAAR